MLKVNRLKKMPTRRFSAYNYAAAVAGQDFHGKVASELFLEPSEFRKKTALHIL